MQMHEYGTGDRVFVLLHGIPGSSAIWQRVALDLAREHRVLVPDLLGFGQSPRPSSIDALWADAQAQALHDALKAAGVKRAVLAGHDFGGVVALALAQQPGAPDLIAGLCLAATNVFCDTPIPLPIRAVTWPLVGSLAEHLLFSRPSLAMLLRQGSECALDSQIYLGDASQRHAIATIFVHALRELDSRYAFAEPTLRRLDAPVLVAWGERDPFFPLTQADRTVAAARHGRLAVYDGARHFLPDERPEQLASDLRRLTQDSTP
jgi:pimeloyl-ACP methyl ester carboxylesterase